MRTLLVIFTLALCVLPSITQCFTFEPPQPRTRQLQEISNSLSHHIDTKDSNSNFVWDTPGQGRVPDDCPAWVLDYVSWHKQNRGQPDAQYLVNEGCVEGIGDKLRGVIASFQLAKAHKRVLLLNFKYPGPLEPYLQPTAVDWTIKDLGIDVDKAPQFFNSHLPQKRDLNFTFVKNAAESNKQRVWILRTNQNVIESNDPGLGAAMKSVVSWDGHCIFQLLFKPSPDLARETDRVQKQMLGSSDKPYVAIHLRMGHMAGELISISRGGDPFEDLLSAYRCARERNSRLHSNGSVVPIALLTDHMVLRDLVAVGMMHGVVGPPYQSHHTGHLTASNVQDTMHVWADFMLLSRARCVVWSRSGFTYAAMALGWPSCTISAAACRQEVFHG